MQQKLIRRIRKLMQRNRRKKDEYTYTVPSPELYPFQWLWDSCFHAIILSYWDQEAACQELRSALAKPLGNGLLPHIIYWKDDYRVTNWGREMRGDIISESWGTDGTSAITQPPVIASTVLTLYRRFDNRAFLEECYPELRSYYLCLLKDRDPLGTGLAGIINPDESGEDNSPRFDDAQGLPPRHTDHQNLDRRIERIKQNKECRYDAYECMRDHFWVEDVSFNAILSVALDALGEIADVIGERADAHVFRLCAAKTREAMRACMHEDGVFYSLEGHDRIKIRIQTWNIFMPLYAKLLTQGEATELVEKHLLNHDAFWCNFPIPSVAFFEPSFLSTDFWRGPTWMAPNWFIHQGLKKYGFNDLAQTIKQRSIELIERSGFREYYDPLSGEGLGSRNFTWGALVIDMED